MIPLISIIIPCYNHGKYLTGAIASAKALSKIVACEIIIVDDGSTDVSTISYLNELKSDSSVTVLFQENKGPSAARNNGIIRATSRYILPLDADNRINPEAFARASSILNAQPEIAIIYGDQARIGAVNEIIQPGPFNLQRLMLANYIDVCALFRREVWEVTGGYDERFRHGLEDWEFWLHAAFKGFKFHYEPEVQYDYTVLSASRTEKLIGSKSRQDAIQALLIAKHPSFYGPQFVDADLLQKLRKSLVGFAGKLILMAYLPRQFQKLVNKGRLRQHL